MMHTQAGRIVVGYDRSESAGAAVDWAAEQAQARQLPLTVMSVVDYAGMLPGVYSPPAWATLFREEAEEIAAEGVQRARKRADSIDVRAEAVVGQVAAALISASQEADRLVIGTRGRGEVTGTVLGSVGLAVTAHAQCPVVVVRGDTTAPGPQRPVLVGVDDSVGARGALRVAADLAAATGASLIVATTYRPVSNRVWAESGYYSMDVPGTPRFDDLARESAGNVTADAVRTARELHPDLATQELVIAGRPGHELVRAAEGCGLLVVGSRGHGGFAGLMLGSVSHDVIHAAPCPVVVVPRSDS